MESLKPGTFTFSQQLTGPVDEIITTSSISTAGIIEEVLSLKQASSKLLQVMIH